MTPVYDRLEAATLVLTQSGAIKDRLMGAWRHYLQDMDVDALPHGLRRQYLELAASLTRERPLRGEDAVRATIRKMSAGEAELQAARIVRLFRDLMSREDLDSPPVAGTVVPLFAAERG